MFYSKIISVYSSWEDILFEVSLPFSMFLSDFFLIVDDVDIANYAYDNTIYKEHENIDDLITSLQSFSKGFLAAKWSETLINAAYS